MKKAITIVVRIIAGLLTFGISEAIVYAVTTRREINETAMSIIENQNSVYDHYRTTMANVAKIGSYSNESLEQTFEKM